MFKRLARKVGTLVLLLAATAWLATAPGYEPLITFLTLLGALVAYEVLDVRAARRHVTPDACSPTPGPPPVPSGATEAAAGHAMVPAVPRPALRPAPAALAEHVCTADALFRYLQAEERAVPLSELNRKQLHARLLGIEVSWPLRVQTLAHVSPGSFIVTGVAGVRLIEVFDVTPSTSPDATLLKVGDQILATGAISVVYGHTIYLTAGRVSLLPGTADGV